MTGHPVIVTALMGDADFAWADGLRRAHFPPARNKIPAHISLFHHLPPARLDELKTLLKSLCARPRPKAEVVSVMDLGGGVALRVDSPDLIDLHARVAEWFAADLIAQDRGRPRLHITVQNKVQRDVAQALFREMSAGFVPRSLSITAIGLWAYMGGPWDALGKVAFRG